VARPPCDLTIYPRKPNECPNCSQYPRCIFGRKANRFQPKKTTQMPKWRCQIASRFCPRRAVTAPMANCGYWQNRLPLPHLSCCQIPLFVAFPSLPILMPPATPCSIASRRDQYLGQNLWYALGKESHTKGAYCDSICMHFPFHHTGTPDSKSYPLEACSPVASLDPARSKWKARSRSISLNRKRPLTKP
jgi:hypothetical protein